MTQLLLILLQDVPAAATQSGSAWGTIFMMVALFAVFYFFMIRPQRKQQQKIEEQRSQLKTGSKVVTAGGIHGVIKNVNDTTFVIEIAKDTKITVDKTSVYPEQAEEPKKEEKKEEPKKEEKKEEKEDKKQLEQEVEYRIEK